MGIVLKVEEIGTPATVYDPACEYPHAYISNGFVSHNCVLLLDEVEKIFSGNDDQGVTQRILSQLLWWLSEHRSKVLTVMTTNHLDNIPPELYRPGRIDRVVEIKRLTLTEAKLFASKVFKSVLAVDATMKQQNLLRQTIENLGKASLAHSEVAETVFELIKQRSWLPFDLD